MHNDKNVPEENTNQVKQVIPAGPAPLTPSERFTNAVLSNFSTNGGQVALTTYQKKLINNYFIKIDMTLKDLEVKRLATAENYREVLAYTWQNVNLSKLSIDVISFSGVGLDPTQKNHLNIIPYKNKQGIWDFTFMPGYKGIEIKAKKYGLDVPDDVVVEVVYKNDKFTPHKKGRNNPKDDYEFEVVNPFERGELVGGFYYHHFVNHPEKCKLEIYSKADIDKRKPKHAAAEFWGGQKDNWEWDNAKGRNVKNGTVEVEGWYDEMAYKTIYRAAYDALTIDSEKIDEHYLAVMQREKENVADKVIAEIAENANGAQSDANSLGFDDHEEVKQDKIEAPISATVQNFTSAAEAEKVNAQPQQEMFPTHKDRGF